MQTRVVLTRSGVQVRIAYHPELLQPFYETPRTNPAIYLNRLRDDVVGLLRRGA